MPNFCRHCYFSFQNRKKCCFYVHFCYKIELILLHWVKNSSTHLTLVCTGKSFSEAVILALTNPQYDKRLFIELRVQYIKITNSEHVVYINCVLFFFLHSEQFMYTSCSELVIFMYWTCNSLNNLLSYCGLVDGRIRASVKDLPVSCTLDTGHFFHTSLTQCLIF
jgi:hypothetical protein